MAFDPSVIGDIQGPDIAGATARGFQLKDLADATQLRSLKLGQEKQALADQAKVKNILSGSDLSNNKGVAEASEKLTKAGMPDAAMDLRKHAASVESGELDNQLKRVDLHSAAQDVISTSVDKLWQQATAMKNEKTADGRPKYTDASINAWIQGQIPLTLNAIQSDTGLPDPVKKTALGGLQQQVAKTGQVTYDQLTEFERSTKQGQAQLKSHRDDLVAQTGRNKEEEVERENRARDTREDRKIGDAEKKEEQRKKEATEGIISDQATDLAVDRILNGEKAQDVLANFGRGKQGGNNISKVQNRLAEVAKARGIDAAEIASRNIELKGLVKEEQTEASIAGKITYAEKEINKIGPQVLALSEKVPRGQFVPFNKLKNYTKEQLSDPNLKQLKAYLTTLSNSYDVLGGRGGTDVEKRAHNRELLNAADSPQALKAAVDAIVSEAALSHEAATESTTVDRSRFATRKDSENPPSGGGNVLKFDAQGNPVK